jgi:glycosyltransferase involved in cell wall biosynthesis
LYSFVGRLVADKGINELIQAFQKVAGETNEVKLLLVGAFETDLDSLVREAPYEITANNKIISVGFQKEVRPYFSLVAALDLLPRRISKRSHAVRGDGVTEYSNQYQWSQRNCHRRRKQNNNSSKE